MRISLRLRWARLKRSRKFIMIPAVLATVVFCAVLWCGIDRCLHPVIEKMAVSSAVNRVSEAVSSAVADCVIERQLGYDDFITLEKDEEGRISSLTGSVISLSQLKRDLVNDLIGKLDGLKEEEFGIPLGTLTGWIIFSGKGPMIQMELLSVGDVTVETRHEFEDAGINQTLHQIYLDVSSTIYLMIPGELLSRETVSSVCVAETVIIGEVPDTYLYLGNGEES